MPLFVTTQDEVVSVRVKLEAGAASGEELEDGSVDGILWHADGGVDGAARGAAAVENRWQECVGFAVCCRGAAGFWSRAVWAGGGGVAGLLAQVAWFVYAIQVHAADEASLVASLTADVA